MTKEILPGPFQQLTPGKNIFELWQPHAIEQTRRRITQLESREDQRNWKAEDPLL